jgi:hypothetical protein
MQNQCYQFKKKKYIIVNILWYLWVISSVTIRVMVFSATFNNILFILTRSVFSVEETGVPGYNHQPVASHLQTLSYNVWSCSYGTNVVGFTTTYAKSVSITTYVVSSNPAHGEAYSIQHYMIKFVSDLRQVGGYIRVLRFLPPKKRTARRHAQC